MKEQLTWTCCGYGTASRNGSRPGRGVPANPGPDRTRPRSGRSGSPAWLARRADRRRAVEPAAARARDRGADRARARPRGADRRRADRVRRAIRLATSRWRSCAPTNDPQLIAMYEGRWEEFGAESTETFRARVADHRRRDRRRASRASGSSRCATAASSTSRSRSCSALDRHLWFEPHYTSLSRMIASRTGVRSVASLNERAHLDATRGDGSGSRHERRHRTRRPRHVVTIDRPDTRATRSTATTAAELADAFRAFDADDDARRRGPHRRGRHVLRGRRPEGDRRRPRQHGATRAATARWARRACCCRSR